jgi:hypothetical protein
MHLNNSTPPDLLTPVALKQVCADVAVVNFFPAKSREKIAAEYRKTA